MHALNIDLNSVPVPYQKPLSRYLWHGAIPYQSPPLMAALTGHRDEALLMDPAMEIVLALLDAHETEIDIAHGHIAWLLRWQQWGGKVGRA